MNKIDKLQVDGLSKKTQITEIRIESGIIPANSMGGNEDSKSFRNSCSSTDCITSMKQFLDHKT